MKNKKKITTKRCASYMWAIHRLSVSIILSQFPCATYSLNYDIVCPSVCWCFSSTSFSFVCDVVIWWFSKFAIMKTCEGKHVSVIRIIWYVRYYRNRCFVCLFSSPSAHFILLKNVIFLFYFFSSCLPVQCIDSFLKTCKRKYIIRQQIEYQKKKKKRKEKNEKHSLLIQFFLFSIYTLTYWMKWCTST